MGTKDKPRLCVFYSNNHAYAQLINDEKSVVLASANSLKMKNPTDKAEKTKEGEVVRTAKAKLAFEVGKAIAKAGIEKKIEKVVFDRGGFKYHGVVKALAEGAREGGLKF